MMEAIQIGVEQMVFPVPQIMDQIASEQISDVRARGHGENSEGDSNRCGEDCGRYPCHRPWQNFGGYPPRRGAAKSRFFLSGTNRGRNRRGGSDHSSEIDRRCDGA